MCHTHNHSKRQFQEARMYKNPRQAEATRRGDGSDRGRAQSMGSEASNGGRASPWKAGADLRSGRAGPAARLALALTGSCCDRGTADSGCTRSQRGIASARPDVSAGAERQLSARQNARKKGRQLEPHRCTFFGMILFEVQYLGAVPV